MIERMETILRLGREVESVPVDAEMMRAVFGADVGVTLSEDACRETDTEIIFNDPVKGLICTMPRRSYRVGGRLVNPFLPMLMWAGLPMKDVLELELNASRMECFATYYREDSQGAYLRAFDPLSESYLLADALVIMAHWDSQRDCVNDKEWDDLMHKVHGGGVVHAHRHLADDGTSGAWTWVLDLRKDNHLGLRVLLSDSIFARANDLLKLAGLA